MKLIRNSIAASIAFAALAVAACSSNPGSTTGGSSNGGSEIGSLNGQRGEAGSVGMHLTVPPGVHINALNWTISNGTNTYTGTVTLTTAAGEAQSVEFVAGGIQAGTGYTVTLSGSDSAGDPCTGTSAAVSVVGGATSSAVVSVICTAPTDASVGQSVDTGNISVDAGVVVVNQNPFGCPGITGVSISPAEIAATQTAALTATDVGGSGGTTTLEWTASGGTIDNPTSASATYHCPGAGVFTVTLTVGLIGTGADGGTVGQVCTGALNSTSTQTITCEAPVGFACLDPNFPNVCGPDGGQSCVNFKTDSNNCGSCGNPCTGGATCVNGTCQTAPPSACTSAPCAASGPNSVKCPNSPTSDGVCTATEAAIVARDIQQGNLTGGQLTPFSATNNGSCYTCLNAKACLDDNQQDVGNECGDSQDLTGGAAGSGVGLCMATLGCILQTDCQGAGGIASTSANASQENVQLCYCGGNNAGGACQTAGSATNGLCVQQEAAGFGLPFTDNKDILGEYGAQPLPSGIANALFQCAASNHCTICQ